MNETLIWVVGVGVCAVVMGVPIYLDERATKRSARRQCSRCAAAVPPGGGRLFPATKFGKTFHLYCDRCGTPAGPLKFGAGVALIALALILLVVLSSR